MAGSFGFTDLTQVTVCYGLFKYTHALTFIQFCLQKMRVLLLLEY